MAFNWLKKKKSDPEISENPPAETPQPVEVNEKIGYFQRLKQGLSKTRQGFGDVFLGKKKIDGDTLEDLEMLLLSADVGIETTETLIDAINRKIKRNEVNDSDALHQALHTHMCEILTPFAEPLDVSTQQPFIILMTGINGAGKTTTIGKLTQQFKNDGKKVMLAAGDTFRAAAVEQLKAWGERNDVPVIAQNTGADSASVAYDAVQSAQARNMDVLIIDTAGRLHTQDHLMEELKKIKRVIQKVAPDAPHETMLVIDAGNGQNALRQAREFDAAMQIDGITLTKLDGTAKGGIIFAITHALQRPVRYIGVGEHIDDLRVFNAQTFVDALLYKE
ncbi:signal recognition particle-docking protein FtsY [Suttonella sp. R2A3]|uniref:signal recognition particle-docking protein FtsY n=1 Tax=Suttonella sp. R2A3 TaxID=2908648 RepID=UPI001F3231E8|nr:signal recognition particle-docking protein FtsY [Suttonella sp. R2A3]UJF25134.1 signal recognition particle-docking protein FtsY [Suttonella sp. R2A3]